MAYLADNPNAQYIVAGPGAFPNVRRNTLALPRINNVDLTAMKRFNITERVRLELSGAFLNVLNHPQFVAGFISDVASNGNTSGGALSFVTPSDANFANPKVAFSSHPRQTVLVLKLSF